MDRIIDILESRIAQDIMNILLHDQTRNANIFWATSDYEQFGEGFQYNNPITYELIKNNNVIVPRIYKSQQQKTNRSREMAEVFTPSWICNCQNNLIDNQWFGKENVFNIEVVDEHDNKSWKTVNEKICFPENKTWLDYVCESRLEISCGEAPFLVSRYDTTTGAYIPVPDRIGLLDRKLRVVSENTNNVRDWLSAAKLAYKSIYAFEWQGDNLLLARESLLQTFLDYYCFKFPAKYPTDNQLKEIAKIISWNIWQMDGLKGVIPNTCHEEEMIQTSLFETQTQTQMVECIGCKNDNILQHNGVKCIIMDWEKKKPIEFVSLISN